VNCRFSVILILFNSQEMLLITDEQIKNRYKTKELSKELEKDLANQKNWDTIKQLEQENGELHNKSKELSAKY
jgi:hypothetical protein